MRGSRGAHDGAAWRSACVCGERAFGPPRPAGTGTRRGAAPSWGRVGEGRRDGLRALVIEDDPQTADFIAKGLRQEGHAVEVAREGRDGLFHALDGGFDVLIVDRMVPGLDGLSIVKSARGAGVKTPILFLTTMGGVDDRVAGLEAGADDYLVKPFAFAELLARLNALARRAPLAEAPTRLVAADLDLDLLARKVTRAGRDIELTPLEFQLLEELMKAQGRVVTRTMLLEKVWGFHFDPKTSVVETHISRLRAKVDKGYAVELIQTARGAGYMIRP